MIINDLFNNKKFVAEEESEAAARRKQYPSYYQHRDAGTVFRTQNDVGQTMNITPDDEEWDDYYRQQFPDMPTPNDGGFWSDDNTAAMVEGMAGKVVFSGTGADGGTYEIIQSSPTDFIIHANGRHIDTYGSLQRAMSVLQNEVPGLQQGVAEGDGFDVVSNYQNMRTTDAGNKSNQTYTSTAIAKNPTTGQQKSLASWDHTDPKTGKNYSGSNYIDPQGNAEVQKNYEESKNKVNEVSLGDYRKKAMMSKAMAQTNKFFDRDNPAKVAAADRTIANRTKGLAGADARRKPYTAPPVDQDKQRRDLADKYPNIDELVRQAELRRDPQYDRADGPAYYDGRDAEHNYHRLKQIQRMIRGTELDEMDFGVSQTTDSDTGDVTTNFNQGPMSVSQTKTPGGYTKQTDQQVKLGAATLGTKTVGPNIGAGQLAGTTTKTATNTATGQAKQQVKGVGFGGASGATVGKNYVGAGDNELAKHAADSTFGVNEETKQATLNTPVGDFTANITKDKSTNTMSGTMPIGGTTLRATKDMTPGGAQSFSVDKDVTPNLNLSATKKSADYNKGQLAGTRSVAAKYTDATGALGQPGQQHTATRTMGVGFGGASGANVGKNYVDQYSVNESIDRIKHLAGIKPAR